MLNKIKLIMIGVVLVGAMTADVSAQDRRQGARGSHGGSHGHSYRGPRYPYARHYRGPDLGTVIIGGAIGTIFGNWLAPRERVVVVPAARDLEWCVNRYKSYDVYTRTYLGYDGLRHGCP